MLYRAYTTDMLEALVRKQGYEVEDSWYDLAYPTGISIEDEQQKAMEAFAKG